MLNYDPKRSLKNEKSWPRPSFQPDTEDKTSALTKIKLNEECPSLKVSDIGGKSDQTVLKSEGSTTIKSATTSTEKITTSKSTSETNSNGNARRF